MNFILAVVISILVACAIAIIAKLINRGKNPNKSRAIGEKIIKISILSWVAINGFMAILSFIFKALSNVT